MKKEIKKIHVVTKTLFQIFLVLIEVGGIGLLIAHICNIIVPASDFVEHISRFLLGSSIYELIIFFTLTQLNDIKADSYLALLTLYKKAELLCDYENWAVLEKDLENQIKYQLDNGTLNDVKVRQEYKLLEEAIKTREIKNIKYKIIILEHCYEACSLKWRYSIFLRLFK